MFRTFLTIFKANRPLAPYPVIHLIQKSLLHKKPIPVTWSRPELGWTKLNFDGSSNVSTGEASIGGVFRNHKAEFLLGYAEPIGKTTSTVAELVALRRGLELVLENDWNRVWLEGDEKSLVEIIVRKRRAKCEEVREQVSLINSIISELESCIISHVFREGNRAADKFARMGHLSNKARVWRYVPPDQILPIVLEDAKGKIVLRRR